MANKIILSADSTCDLGEELKARYNVSYYPFHIILDEKDYQDNVDITVKENTVKEVKEEAGLDVTADLVIALQEQRRRNRPVNAYGICKVFVLCSLLGGSFQPNLETLDSRWFALDELPPLSTGKTTEEQIRMCFDAYHAEHWTTLLD